MPTNEFQRVKNLWQARVGRSQSTDSVVTHRSAMEMAVNDYQDIRALSPHTPKIDGELAPSLKLDNSIPFSPASSSSTSASGLDSPNVASTLRTFSDACVYPTRVPKSPSRPDSTSPSTPSSSLLSFAPPLPTPWGKSRSASFCTSSSSATSFSLASVRLSSKLAPRQAAEHALTNVHHVSSKCPSLASSSIFRGSPYGELILVDILEAKGLARDRDEKGIDRPFHVSLQLGEIMRQTHPTSRDSMAVNERFVFWLPSSVSNDQKTFDLYVQGHDERDLGEVHLSLAMPLNETFADWYPLICRSNGVKRGAMLVAMHRFVLTSSLLHDAAKTLSERNSCLRMQDRTEFGELFPQLWTSFPGTTKRSTTVVPNSKFKRLMSLKKTRRDVL